MIFSRRKAALEGTPTDQMPLKETPSLYLPTKPDKRMEHNYPLATFKLFHLGEISGDFQ